jgi:hypothetical protein
MRAQLSDVMALLRTIFVSGPPKGGKTQLVHLMAKEALSGPPHHMRLVPSSFPVCPQLSLVPSPGECSLASSRRVPYNTERCFEAIEEALKSLRPTAPCQVVLLEADGDPCLRYAYPYDRRVFVMPAPGDIYNVFRTPEQAALALRKVMEDTASFAAEIFGLFDEDALGDDVGVEHLKAASAWSWDQPAEEVLQVDETQLRNFLDSPIGVEIASRIQLQPEYHGLVESDVILINTGVGATGNVIDEVARRLDLLLGRIRGRTPNDGLLFCCDPLEPRDPRRVKLFEKLSLMNHALAS